MVSENSFTRPLLSLKSFGYFIELYLLYFLIAYRLRKQGLKKTVAQCTAISTRKAGWPDAWEADTVMLARNLTREVLNWHVMPTSCVPNSLLICWFLARRGIKADFTITVRPYPFMAHAQAHWHEIPLTDPPPASTLPGIYVPIMRK